MPSPLFRSTTNASPSPRALAVIPKDLLKYVIVHEMAHLLEPAHNERFIAILQEYYPTWREARAELNELPLSTESWKE